MRVLFNWFVYGNIWVSICASALCWLTYFEFGLEPSVQVLPFLFFSTLIVYNMNMISGLNSLKKHGTDSMRHHWCLENAGLMKLNVVLGMLGASYCFALLNIETWLVLTPFAVASILYVVPLLGNQVGGKRLRELGLNKIFTISVVWSSATVLLPLVNELGLNVVSYDHLWPATALRTVFIFAITLPFDIRDLKNDQKINVRTIPMILGLRRTLVFSVSFLALYGAVYAITSDYLMLGVGHLIGALITALLVLMTKENRGDMFYSFTLEGTMVILPLCVYGSSLLC